MLRRMHSQSGWTLTETVLSIAISALVGLGLMLMLRGGAESSGNALASVKQNSELRNAMTLVSRDLGNADKPAVGFGDLNGESLQIDTTSQGDQVIFTRTEQRLQDPDDAGPTPQKLADEYFAERVYFDRADWEGSTPMPSDPATRASWAANSAEARLGQVRMQVKSLTTEQMRKLDPDSDDYDRAFQADLANPASSFWQGAPTRVLVDSAYMRPNERLFSFYASAGKPTVNTFDVSLVDVNLRSLAPDREQGRTDRGLAVQAASDAPAATLRSSVYLRKIGQRHPGNGTPVNC